MEEEEEEEEKEEEEKEEEEKEENEVEEEEKNKELEGRHFITHSFRKTITQNRTVYQINERSKCRDD